MKNFTNLQNNETLSLELATKHKLSVAEISIFLGISFQEVYKQLNNLIK